MGFRLGTRAHQTLLFPFLRDINWEINSRLACFLFLVEFILLSTTLIDLAPVWQRLREEFISYESYFLRDAYE